MTDRAKCYKCGSERVVGSVTYCAHHAIGEFAMSELGDEELPRAEKHRKMREAFELIMKNDPVAMVIHAEVADHREGEHKGEDGTRVISAALGSSIDIIAINNEGSKALHQMIVKTHEPGMNG